MKKEWRELDLNQGSHAYQTDALAGMAIGDLQFLSSIFDKIIQLLLHSKVTKAELYLINGYHNEWLELTYYIESLKYTS